MNRLEVTQVSNAIYQCYRRTRMLESMIKHLNPDKPNMKLVAKIIMTIIELVYYHIIIYHLIKQWTKEMEPRIMYFCDHLRDYFPYDYPEIRPERLLTS